MSRHWKHAAAVCLVTCCLWAQAPAGTPTFQSSATLIEVTTVVRDAQGRAVEGLSAGDFQLFDAGKRQAITSFEVVKAGNRELTSVREGNSVAPGRAANAPPDRFVAFVVDDANLVPEQMPAAIVAAIRHLADLRPGDRAAVLATSGRLVLPFTSDKEKLRDALSRISSMNRRETFNVSGLNSEIRCMLTYVKADWIGNGDAASLQNCVPPAWAQPPQSAVPQRPAGGLATGPPGEYQRIRLENQVRAFADSVVQAGDRDVQSYFLQLARLIGGMSRMPGERSIILLSPGMYIPARLRSLRDSTIQNAVRSQVVISGVDPRGVYRRNDPDDPSTWTDAWGVAETNERLGFMEDVTSGTGGTFIHGDNGIEGALRRLDSTPELLYVLGFSPESKSLDGTYHRLKVVLPRRRAVTVTARRGYYAIESKADLATAAEREVESAFFSSRELHDLPVRLQVRSSHKPEGITLTAVAQVDVQKLLFRKNEAVNRSEVRLLIGLFDGNGNLVKDFQRTVALTPDDAELEALRSSGIEATAEFEVTPGRYVVRFLARDDEGQAMGTQSLPVVIRE